MKPAFSNIAWDPDQDDSVGALLARSGVASVEIAPTKYFAAPCAPSEDAIAQVRRAWQARGQEVVACQALLFQMNHLNLLGGAGPDAPQKQQETIQYLDRILQIGAQLGAKRFVFGSPKNRDRSGLDDATAHARAIDAFTQLAQRAAKLDVVFCIEPNPTQYQCNFLTTAAEAQAIVEEVDHPGLGLHLDTGIMRLNGEDPAETIERGLKWLRHFHISEPNLAAVGQGDVDHAVVGRALKALNYQGHVSVEMRGGPTPAESFANVERACQTLAEFYL
jgi:D-psicose/D-tagatose/L-ribulose 3-epimerase